MVKSKFRDGSDPGHFYDTCNIALGCVGHCESALGTTHIGTSLLITWSLGIMFKKTWRFPGLRTGGEAQIPFTCRFLLKLLGILATQHHLPTIHS